MQWIWRGSQNPVRHGTIYNNYITTSLLYAIWIHFYGKGRVFLDKHSYLDIGNILFKCISFTANICKSDERYWISGKTAESNANLNNKSLVMIFHSPIQKYSLHQGSKKLFDTLFNGNLNIDCNNGTSGESTPWLHAFVVAKSVCGHNSIFNLGSRFLNDEVTRRRSE